MNALVLEDAGWMIKLADRYPHLGIFASIGGFTASILSLLKILSFVFGVGGALFGLLAGYYTWRIQRHKWHTIQQHGGK